MFYDDEDDDDQPTPTTTHEETSPGPEGGDYTPPEDITVPGETEGIDNSELG